MSDKGDLVFLEHMLDCIGAIEQFAKNITKNELDSNRLKRSAIVREIEIIGEAAKNISLGLKNKHKEVEWKDIAGTRDKMIHHYFGVDTNIVLDIIKIDLPKLKKQILQILKSLEDN